MKKIKAWLELIWSVTKLVAIVTIGIAVLAGIWYLDHIRFVF